MYANKSPIHLMIKTIVYYFAHSTILPLKMYMFFFISVFIFYFTFRVDMDKWYSWFNSAFQRCPPALPWFVDYITDDPQTYIV